MESHVGIDVEGQWFKFQRSITFQQAFFKPTHPIKLEAIPQVSKGIVRIECDGALVSFLRLLPIPVVTAGDNRQRIVGFSEVLIQLESP